MDHVQNCDRYTSIPFSQLYLDLPLGVFRSAFRINIFMDTLQISARSESHDPWFDHTQWLKVWAQIMKLIIMKCFPIPRLLSEKYSPQHPFRKHPKPCTVLKINTVYIFRPHYITVIALWNSFIDSIINH
jgi:hypothetical protein